MIDTSHPFDGDPRAAIRLSAAGEQRRLKILAAARDAARGRRRRRIVMRTSVALVAILCGVLPVALLLSRRQATAPPTHFADERVSPAPLQIAPVHPPAQQPPAEIVVVKIHSDPGIADRLAVPPQAPAWRRLTDEDLLRQLADAGRPAGIAYLGGHATLLYHDRNAGRDRTH
jgi:hypothetical protein